MPRLTGADLEWYSVRCIFLDESVGAYEERLTLWSAAHPNEAIELAENEARVYANAMAMVYLEFAQAFKLFDIPGQGAEVFSLIRDSDLLPEQYVDRYFDTGTERQSRY